MTEAKTPPPPTVWPCAPTTPMVTVGLHDTDYGSRDFTIEDQEGNRWAFGTYPGAPR